MAREIMARKIMAPPGDTPGRVRLLHLRWIRPPQPAGLGGYHSLDLWVSAATYLPVRSVTDESVYAPRMESAFTWRPATPRTQAIFTPQIPAGFRYLSLQLQFLPLLHHW
jgi:hypothetical protein